MGTHKTLGEIIKAKRVEVRYSQEELADLMPFNGWHSGTVSALEGSSRSLTFEEAVYLAKVLGCTLDALAVPFIDAPGGDLGKEYAEKLAIKRVGGKVMQVNVPQCPRASTGIVGDDLTFGLADVGAVLGDDNAPRVVRCARDDDLHGRKQLAKFSVESLERFSSEQPITVYLKSLHELSVRLLLPIYVSELEGK